VSGERPKGQTTVVEPTATERTVARRAAESRATVPHLELTVTRRKTGPLDTAALLKACGEALREHPQANSAYRDGHFELYSRVNIGLVLALADGYLVPTVFDADGQTLSDLARASERLHAAARKGELGASAFAGATFTVWNASLLGIAQASLPTVPPQAALLAAGTSALTLTCDHRILYGAPAAEFLSAINRQLEAGAD
jgi:pyruvate dehydrogenase E2 component (dihydrolipoamide acetyltransferase)